MIGIQQCTAIHHYIYSAKQMLVKMVIEQKWNSCWEARQAKGCRLLRREINYVMEGNIVIVDFGDQPDEHGFIFGLNRIHVCTGKKVIQSIVKLM